MKRHKATALLCVCFGLAFFGAARFGLLNVQASVGEPLVVHEWGTFTSVQNSQGENLHGYFINSEPVPPFVHTVGHLIQPLRGIFSEPDLSQHLCANPKCILLQQHPDIVMRLETPVIYFYPPQSAQLPLSLNVNVGMLGGWLTEFYPRAETNITTDDVQIGHALKKDFIGTLSWKDLQIGGNGSGPETTDKVWLAPRNTRSALVQTDAGESEKYLFYRGVANVESPLRVSLDNNTLVIGGAELSWHFRHADAHIHKLWLVDIDPTGNLAFSDIPQIDNAADLKTTVSVPAHFNRKDYAAENLQKLEQAMHAALVREGLFADEATAMLETWEEAYFKAPGTRVFFLVPRPWVDHYLPLDISVPAKIERVMVGRIELQKQKTVAVNLPRGDRMFPSGAGSDVANNNCLACHSAAMVLNQPALSKAQWQAVVKKMITAYKAPVDAKDVGPLVDYLASIRGAGTN